MRISVLIALSLLLLKLSAQQNLYRCMPQATIGSSQYYFNCEMKDPVKTADNGYIFSFLPWSPNLHGAYPADQYTIKTDSNFVPQWQKPYYCTAIPLPTGGIILLYNYMLYNNSYNGTRIEKVTASGTQVWSKSFSNEDIIINDGISYNDKLRLVGRKRYISYITYPIITEISQPYSLEIDTMGTFVSHNLYLPNNGVGYDFSRISRDGSGNFFVYSTVGSFSPSGMLLAKFDPSFNFLWAKTNTTAGQPMYLSDIAFLPSGGILATAMMKGNYAYNYPALGSLFKFDGSGNITQQSFFSEKYGVSGLCKTAANSYVFSTRKNSYHDSLSLVNIDTSMNVLWSKVSSYGLASGKPVQKGSLLYLGQHSFKNPYIISTNLTGDNCVSGNAPLSMISASITMGSVVLTATSSAAVLSNATLNVVSNQPFADSCRCTAGSVVTFSGNTTFCAGTSAALMATGSGTVNWYQSPVGGTPIASNAFTFTPAHGGVYQFYAQDSTCASNSVRTLITVTALPQPTLNFYAFPGIFCEGQNTELYAYGASSYTWNNSVTGSSITIAPPLNSSLILSGELSGCLKTDTFQLQVYPNPTLALSVSQNTICNGESIVILANGAVYYSLNSFWGSSPVNMFTFSPNMSTTYSVTGYDINGCTDTKTGFVTVNQPPNFTASLSDSTVCMGQSTLLSATGANTYSWSTGQTGASIVVTPTANTVYTVTGIGVNGCGIETTLLQQVSVCTEVENHAREFQVNVFPNPGNGIFNVELPAITGNCVFEIINSLGQQILSEQVRSQVFSVDLRQYPRGLYYLKLSGSGYSSVFKILLQ